MGIKVKKNRGFTLIEIVVVLVALAVLAAFAIPTYLGFIAKTHQTEDITNLGFLNRVTTYYGASITIQNQDIFDGLTTDDARMNLLRDKNYLDEILKPKIKDTAFIWNITKQIWEYTGSTGNYVFSALDLSDFLTRGDTWSKTAAGFYSSGDKNSSAGTNNLLFIPNDKNKNESYTITSKAQLDAGNDGGYGILFETSLTNGDKTRDSGYVLQFDRGLNAIVIRQRVDGQEKNTSYTANNETDSFLPTSKSDRFWTEKHEISLQVSNGSTTGTKTVKIFVDGQPLKNSYTANSSTADTTYTGYRSWYKGTTYETMNIN